MKNLNKNFQSGYANNILLAKGQLPMNYSEADKMLLASFIMMDVSALQSENEMCKADGVPLKYGEKDFYNAVHYAEKRLRNF